MSDVEQDFQRFLHPDRQADPAERCDQTVNNGMGEPTECGKTWPCEIHTPAEPTTAAGRRYALHPPGSLDEWERAILAIEAEARQPSGLREALAAVLTSEPEDIPGLDYLIVQIDRRDYAEARAALAADPAAQPEPQDVLRKVREQLTAYNGRMDYHRAMLCVEAVEAAYASRPAEEQ